MKKKILMLVMAFAIILPAAFLLGNTVTLNYTDYYGEFETSYLRDYITVYLNNSDDTKTQINYGEGGYTISGLPSVLNANEAGYDLTISYNGYTAKIKLIVNKGEIDMSGVSWDYDASSLFTYNGNEYSVKLYGLPYDVTAQYTNNAQTNAGPYRAKVQLVYDTTNYKLINDNFGYYLDWEIEKAEINMQGAYWDYDSPFTYNGSEHRVSLQDLPNGISVEYVDNAQTDAGTYTAIANFVFDNNNYQLVYGDFENELEWTINKAGLDLSGISWPSYNFTFNNKLQKITLGGSIPSTVDVIYSDEFQAKNAGTYTVTVEFDYDVRNFNLNLPEGFTYSHEWTIEKASIYLANVNWSNTDLTYNEEEQIVQLTGINNVTEITNVVYKNYYKVNGEYQLIENNPINAGDYKTTVTLVYDNNNYNLTNKNFADEIKWTMAKAENTISGSLKIDDWHYGEEPNEPTGLQALFGNIDYKYYVLVAEEYQELKGVPTDAGTYYVKGFSQGNENWISVEDSIYYSTFKIYPATVGNPSLEQTHYIYTKNAITPTVINLPEGIEVTTTGDTTQTEIGNYTIIISLVDKNNYCWAKPDESGDVVLNWSIIDSPLTMTLNDKALSASEFEALTQVNIGDKWQVSVSEGYNCSLDYEYLNESGNKVWSNTDEGLNGNLTVRPSHLTYVIEITQSAEVVYTKTITVNHDIFENVMVGEVAMTFDEFVANPEVEYGKNLKFNLKTGYESIFTFSANDFEVTENTTITIKYQLSGERVYKTIEVLCVIKPVESVTVGSQTLSYEDFIANPVVKYGDTLSINFKSNYTGFYASHSFPYEVKDDIQVTIYTSTGEIVDEIDVKCRLNVITNIAIDGVGITFEELQQMQTIYLGSTLTFTVNEEFVNVIEVVINNNGQDNVLTGQQTFVFEEINNFYLDIRDKNTQSYINSISLNVIFFDNIEINNKMFNTSSSTYVEYSRDLGENNFVISIDNDLLNEYELFYDTTDNYTKTKFTQSTIEVSIEEIKEYLYIYVIYDNDVIPVLTIHFIDFCPVETVSVQVYQQNSIDNPPYYIDNDEISITSYGVINSLSLTYKDGYTDCAYKIFDENGLEIDDFTTIKNTTYTIKIYSDNTEMQYIGDANVASIVTNDSQLNVPNLTDTEYYTNQSIMFNGSNSVTLTEGQQTIKVVYTFTANQKTYTYTFDLVAEYVPQEESPIHYVTNITVSYTDIWGSQNTVYFDYNLQFSNSEYELSDMAFVDENDINITPYDGYEVVSKEIKFSEDKTYCWLEYVIDVDGQNKTFRAYIKTYGTISNNINAQIIFSDAKTELDITGLFVDNTYTIEKVNVFGDLQIILEDSNARIEYYFNGEIVDRDNIALNPIGTYTIKIISSGTYTVKIISSDKTATKSINIIVQNYDNLMFEVFYESERLYLEYSNNGPIGNMTMKYNPLTGPYFIGYFGEKDLGDLTQVTISGNSAYEEMLYYSDKVTPITNLDNLVLDIMTDTDGALTGIVGGKYVLVYAKIENVYYAVYFIFEDRPPYPMMFCFDTDNDNEITENDTQISLKVNLEEAGTGIVDLGDFYIGESGPSVEVTREELGMAETGTSVNVTVKWSQTFGDYSYYYFTSMPEGQDMPELIGPSEDNMASTLVLNFADNGSGQLVATIYVCSEGATQENFMKLIVPVTFILVD